MSAVLSSLRLRTRDEHLFFIRFASAYLSATFASFPSTTHLSSHVSPSLWISNR
jgi:hypothetical protein